MKWVHVCGELISWSKSILTVSLIMKKLLFSLQSFFPDHLFTPLVF